MKSASTGMRTMASISDQNAAYQDFFDMKLNKVRVLNKQQEENLMLLKSRLNHLQHQDHNCQRNIFKTSAEINNIVDVKSRVYEDQQKKQYVSELKKRTQEDIKERAQELKRQRELRQEKIDQQRLIYTKSQQQLNRIYKNNVKTAKQKTFDEIRSENFKCHDFVRQSYVEALNDKQQLQQQKLFLGQANYQSQLMYEAEKFKETQDIINGLEQNESRIINQLKVTQNKDRSISAKKQEVRKMPIETFTPKKKNLFRIVVQS